MLNVSFHAWLDAYGLKVTQTQSAQFSRYLELLLEWSERMNLTAIREPRSIMIKHFFDSLTPALSPHFVPKGKLLDVGTGAGFPGLPLKIMFPELRVVLLDATKKRIMFLEAVRSSLHLDDLELIHGRAEWLAHDQRYREQFDQVTARAVASLPVLLEYTLPFVRPGGHLFLLKGPSVQQELEDSHSIVSLLGGAALTEQSVFLPEGQGERRILWYKKVLQTPKQYPRKVIHKKH